MAHSTSKQEFVVIGLGRFGTSLALQLIELGYSVLAIDRDRELVQSLANDLTQVVALDATDEDALRSVGIEEFETAVVATGKDFESTILITVLLKELGLHTVICKALTERQKRILLRIGADRVILPEHEAGERLAHQLTSSFLIDQLELEPGVHISEIRCPEAIAGHTLLELALPARFGITVLLIKRNDRWTLPRADTVLASDDLLVIIGPDEAIIRLQVWEP